MRRPTLSEVASRGGSSDGHGLTSRPIGTYLKRDAVIWIAFSSFGYIWTTTNLAGGTFHPIDGDSSDAVYTRSFVIFRHYRSDLVNHPVRDVDESPLRYSKSPQVDVQLWQLVHAEERQPHVSDRWCAGPLRHVIVALVPSSRGLDLWRSYVSDSTCPSPELFSHSPFSRLPPPGNGVPICLAEQLGFCRDAREDLTANQEREKNVNSLTVVDLRTNRIEALEDFHISDTVITLHDFIPTIVLGHIPVQFTF